TSAQPAYVAHRLQHHRATIDARFDVRGMKLGEQAGLAMLQNETHFYAAGVALGHVDLPGKTTAVSVRFKVDGPRLDVLYAVDPGSWHVLLRGLDVSLLSAAIAGGFTGVTFGPYAYLQ